MKMNKPGAFGTITQVHSEGRSPIRLLDSMQATDIVHAIRLTLRRSSRHGDVVIKSRLLTPDHNIKERNY